MCATQNITHCLFDMDGLLLDTEPIYKSIVGDIAKLFGKPYPHDVRMRVLGTTEQSMAKIAVRDLDLPITATEFHHLFTALCRQRFLNLSLMEGAERLLLHLHKYEIPMALATSSSLEMAEIKMTNHQELFSLFNHKVMGSTDPEVIDGKPAPDIFLVAGKRFADKPKPKTCLVFEDAPNGVRAACLAGMPSVMVPDDMVASALRKEATVVIRSLLDFKPEQFGLPPFDDDLLDSSDNESSNPRESTSDSDESVGSL